MGEEFDVFSFFYARRGEIGGEWCFFSFGAFGTGIFHLAVA
jgi:hypothetical protein